MKGTNLNTPLILFMLKRNVSSLVSKVKLYVKVVN